MLQKRSTFSLKFGDENESKSDLRGKAIQPDTDQVKVDIVYKGSTRIIDPDDSIYDQSTPQREKHPLETGYGSVGTLQNVASGFKNTSPIRSEKKLVTADQIVKNALKSTSGKKEKSSKK